jgi:hypothetical protein
LSEITNEPRSFLNASSAAAIAFMSAFVLSRLIESNCFVRPDDRPIAISRAEADDLPSTSISSRDESQPEPESQQQLTAGRLDRV